MLLPYTTNNEINIKKINSKIHDKISLLKSRSFSNLQESPLPLNYLVETTSKKEGNDIQSPSNRLSKQIIVTSRSSSIENEQEKEFERDIENNNSEINKYIKINDNERIEEVKEKNALKLTSENFGLGQELESYSVRVPANYQINSNMNVNDNDKQEFYNQYHQGNCNSQRIANVKIGRAHV